MYNKEKEIESFLAEPIKKGDKILVAGLNHHDRTQKSTQEVVKVDDTNVYFKVYGYSELQSRLISEVTKDTLWVGKDPFKPKVRLSSFQYNIEGVLHRCGYDRREKEARVEKTLGVTIPETTLNPMVVNSEGKEVEFQRGLVWSLEQKQLLIESIYNNIEIGKFVIRKRSWSWVESRVKAGKIKHTAFSDMIDGKQRFTALVEFIENKFPDLHGNYYDDFSDFAKRQFANYSHLTFVELDENASDADALNIFLAINFAGVPMSKEHIEYVKSINLK